MRSYRNIVQLIGATTTQAGLKVRAGLDEKKYPKGVKVSDAQLAAVNLAARFPRRLELHNLSKSHQLTTLFMDKPLEVHSDVNA